MDSPLNLRGTLRDMNVSDSLTVPLERLGVVRTTCAALGLELDRKYSASADRQARTITVTRVS